MGFWSATRIGSIGIGKFIFKNWYWFMLLFVLLPTIFLSIHTAIETKNPFYPPLQLGLHLINSDDLMFTDVQILKTDPVKLIGMEKPTTGIYKNLVYKWHIFKVIWKFFGYIWLITFPFVFLFKFIINPRNTSERWKNIYKTLIWGLLFIFFINLIMVIYKYSSGIITNYVFPSGANEFTKAGLIIVYNLPFHGIIALVKYLITLI